jgi:catechol 2,3-dioxygenase-like lactoylglutathione lyase family enzyme
MPADERTLTMSDVIKLSGVGVDGPNAGELAAFYAEITGGTVTSQNEHWASMSGPGGTIDFWTVPDHQPPTWPNGTTPKQLHLDFYVDDLEATQAKVLAAGASKYDFQPNSDHCYVFADPAGHPFCLSTWGDPDE